MNKTIAWAEGTFVNMTEPFTVMLTNEAQQFATDSNRKVTSTQSYYTDIIVIRGSQERTDYTIGNITSGSGITVSKNSKRVTFSVSAGTTIGADAGVIEIPITLDGQTVKKQFSWSCGKQGPQGVKGNDGNSFAWNMLSETNCGKKHWGTESSGGKYSVEDFITEDNIDAVKLICTEAISTSNWSYVSFKDIKMLKQLKPSTKYTLSYDIKANRSGAISHSICKGDVSNFCTNTVVVNNIIGNETWQHISVVLTTNDLKTTPTNEILYLGRNALSKVGYSIIKNLKLVEGDIDTPWSPSQSDIEGKGVVETVQYYLATSQASGVTSSTSGWSTDITTQKLTADKKYLWNCYQTKYSDGTSEPISTPKVIGVYGDKGQTGEDGQDGAGFHWNLLKYSGDLSKQVLGGAGTYTATVESIEDKTTPSGQAEKITYTVQGTGGKFIQTGKYIKEGNIKQGKTYTVSVWCKCSSIKSTGVINAEFLDNKTYVNPTLSTEWQQYVVTGVANKDVTSTSSASAISFYYNDNMSVGDIFYISSPKVEEGDKASPWCTTYEETLAKNLSITPSSQYFKSTDGGKTFTPDTITIKPTIQGEISFGKWQYSIDGGVSFADIVSGQKGLTINNNVLTVSKDSSLYSDAVTMVTFRAVANDSSFYDTCSIAKIYDVSDIGDGRNLIQKSQLNPIDGAELSLDDYTKNGTVIFTNKSKNSGFSFDSYNNYQPNSKYVLSYYFTKTSGTINSFGGFHNGKRVVYTSFFVDDKVYDTASYAGGSSQIGTILNDGKRHRIVVCYTTPDTIATDTSVNYTFIQPGRGNTNPNFGVKIEELKLEKGSSPTGWSAAPEDVQTAILSTKSEISDVSLKVDKNKQAIEQRVEKTTYQQDLNLVKGDISKANEGLNKWRYEIYPKSLFTDRPEDQRKISLDVFARNKNIIPTQSILLDDTKLGYLNYDDNYIGYAVTFVKMSEATKLETTFVHDDAGSFYLNGKLICTNGTNNFYSSATPDTVSCTLVKGWNCLEVVINEGAGSEGFKFGTVLSQLSTCQLMNCYYAMVTGRESQITNTLVQNTIDIEGVSTKVGKVTSIIGENGENFTDFKNDYSDFKQTMNGFKTTVGQTYVTKDDFNGLEIGGRNLLLYSQTVRAHNDYYNVGWLTDEVETFNGCPVWSVKNQWGKLGWSFKSHVIDRGLVKVGDTLTYSLYAKTNNASGKRIACSYRFKGNAQGYWFNDSAFNVDTSWARYSVTFTVTKDMLATDTYMNEIGFGETASMSGDDKVYYACPKLERGTKATDYTPAPEDNEINGQNLVSNLPSNWEQGGINGGQAVGSTYASIKSSTAYRIRIKDIFSVSGNITVSAGGTTTNSSKETLSFYGTLYDAKKGLLRETGWKSFPSTINCGDAKYMSIILRWGDGTKTQITPPDISQICLKIERGTSATPFTLAPEDVNGKIVNVETIANQTANKFEWIVKGGDSSSNFTLTDRVADLVAERINFKGLITFSGLNTDAKNEIGKVAQSKVDGLEVGGRNLLKHSSMIGEKLVCDNYVGCNNCDTKEYTNEGFHIITPTEGNANNGIAFSFDNFTILGINGGDTITFSCDIKGTSDSHAPFISIHISDNNWYGSDVIQKNTSVSISSSWQRVSVTITTPTGLSKNHMWLAIHGNYQSDLYVRNFKLEKGNKATDWMPAPEDVSQDASNKANQALTDAKNYSSNAVNWVTNNGSSTTSLNSMVKKWTDGAVSDTTQINGGWIKANTITASKIAIGDFTNYCQLNKDTASSYGFTATDDIKGVWFTASPIDRDKDISQWFTCEGGQKLYVEYDLSTTVKGKLKASDTDISYLTSGIMIFVTNGTKEIISYTRSKGVTATSDGAITHISLVETLPADARFFKVVLQTDGQRNTFSGTLKIRNPQVRKATTGKLIVDGSITADKIATDAIKSRNYISSGGTQGSFLNLSDGSFTSPNLSWDSNGNLIATNANLSGQITATDGSIGKFKITDQWLITGSGSTCTGIGGNQAFWAGAESSDSAPFRVGYDGKFVSSNADISGKISATSGKVGKYEITDTYLKTGSGSTCSGIGSDDCAFWAGGTNSKDSNFIVSYDGSVFANNLMCNDRNSNDALAIMNGTLYIYSDNNSSFLSSTGFEFKWGGDCRILSMGDGVKCYRNLYATDFIADGWIYNASGGHYTWKDRADAYISCGNYNNTNNIYYYAGYHAFYVNGDSGSGMMYIETSGVSSRKGFRNSSDERIKQNFSRFDDNFIDTYMNLEPVQYQFKNDTNDKYHFGFKAQQTERILNAYGQESDKSYGLCATHAIDPEKAEKLYGVKDMHEEYTLAYDELIAPTTYMVQHTYKELESTKGELEQVKQEKADLEARLQAIEAKLRL